MKRAQSAVEFVILVSFMFFVFIVFFFSIQSQIIDRSVQVERETMASVHSFVRQQFIVARSTPTDFVLSFQLPSLSQQYEAQLDDSFELIISLEDETYVDFLPFSITGSFNPPGEVNRIYHLSGEVIHPILNTSFYHSDAAGLFLNIDARKCFRAQLSFNCDTYLMPEQLDACRVYTSFC